MRARGGILEAQARRVHHAEEEGEVDLGVALVDLRDEAAVDRREHGPRRLHHVLPVQEDPLHGGLDELLHVAHHHGRVDAVAAHVPAVDADARLVDAEGAGDVAAQLLAGDVLGGHRHPGELRALLGQEVALDGLRQRELAPDPVVDRLDLARALAHLLLQLRLLQPQGVEERRVHDAQLLDHAGQDVARDEGMLVEQAQEVRASQGVDLHGARRAGARRALGLVQDDGGFAEEIARAQACRCAPARNRTGS